MLSFPTTLPCMFEVSSAFTNSQCVLAALQVGTSGDLAAAIKFGLRTVQLKRVGLLLRSGSFYYYRVTTLVCNILYPGSVTITPALIKCMTQTKVVSHRAQIKVSRLLLYCHPLQTKVSRLLLTVQTKFDESIKYLQGRPHPSGCLHTLDSGPG